MAAQAQVQSGFWFEQDGQDRFLSKLKRTLVVSLLLHLVVLLIAAGIRLPQKGERPLASVEVSLVSFPTPVKQVEAKPVPQKQQEPVRQSPSKTIVAPPVPQAPPTPQPLPAPQAPPVPQVPVAQVPPEPVRHEPKPVPAAPVAPPVPNPVPVAPPARQSIAKDILRDLQLPPDAPKIGDFTPQKSVARPQPYVPSKVKVPDLVRIPDVAPEPSVKAPQQASLSDELDRELEDELKKIKQFQPATRIETPKDVQAKPALKQEAAIPAPQAVTKPQTTIKTSGSSGTNPYWARIESIIKSQWEPPPIDVSGSSYHVVVKFRFFRNGTVKDVGIQQSSGNDYFDMAGQRAVLKPRVFPPFPAEMTESYQDVEMVFRVGEAVG
ncbi:hypothetical protein W02_15490 [Nitrospira sp. KM1]|uniref:TonB family protein n=1 Tax=Nitrospira sp. KM1 TaxID=1936990 RepID=UPI0013A7A1C9|nr:TonB family protein [Nitrospira sp. KM1]BCA54409.1 hypothetical protein W02_15490 [Nitrospira sp. KM1]